jgi:hypothetical protein
VLENASDNFKFHDVAPSFYQGVDQTRQATSCVKLSPDGPMIV